MSKYSARTSNYKANRLLVLKRDEYTCVLQLEGCTVEATEADHVIPKSQGGTDDVDNLVAACKNCNNKKSDTVLTRKNWLNPRWFA
ncbi:MULTISPECIES: HNH endonuclease [Streptomyces]|uniref:HNH endonuclease n=1 Tax=Streptomyces TaxID=1883 RepID=UPI000997992F